MRDIKSLKKEVDYQKQVRVGNFYSNSYIKYESNGNRNKTLSIKEYFDGFKPQLNDIINNSQKPHTQKIQLIIAIIFISSKDSDKEFVMHSKSDSREIMTYDKQMKLLRNFLNHFFRIFKLGWKYQNQTYNKIFFLMSQQQK